jgi:Leucine-rich repeat (LRR) protein
MVQLRHLKLISIIILLLSVSSCAIAQKIDKETQNKIEEAKKTNELKIQNRNRYNEIPDEIFELVNLQTLSFSGSECDVPSCINISRLPAKIKNLKNLRQLNLVMNGLKSLPKELNNIKLESLDISNNFAINISNLNIPSLKILNLNDCDLNNLPNGIWIMKNLTVLGIEGNNNIPDEQITRFKKEMPNCVIYWKY